MEASISQTHSAAGVFLSIFLRDITERERVSQALLASRDELTRLSNALLHVREQEKHIARELHDDLGQSLTALTMELAELETRLPPDDAELRGRVEAIRHLTGLTFTSLRRIAADLRPIMLDDLGLAAAVEWLVSNFVSRYGIDTDAQIEVDQGEPSAGGDRPVPHGPGSADQYRQARAGHEGAGAAVLQRHAVHAGGAGQRRRRHAGQPGPQAAARAGPAGHPGTGQAAAWRCQHQHAAQWRLPPEGGLAGAIATAGPATLGGHMIAVLLADDHTLVREGLCRLLERAGGIAVQGQASNGGEALRLLAQRPWDLLVLDMSMPGRDGVDLIRQIRRDHPAVPILVLTMHGEQQYAVQAIKAGAAGYLTKDCAAAQLEQAVRKVAAGGRYLSPSIAESIAFERHGDSNAEPHLLLSDRESAVFRHLARGLKNADIGKLLCLSVKTISTYKSRILVKMRLRNQADLIRYALKHRLIDADDDAGN